MAAKRLGSESNREMSVAERRYILFAVSARWTQRSPRFNGSTSVC